MGCRTPQYHRRSLEFVSQIGKALGQHWGKKWSTESATHSEGLEEDHLDLAEGVAIVREWIMDLRRYLGALGATDLLPPPDGEHPSVTVFEPEELAAAPGRQLPLGVKQEDVNRVLKAIEIKGSGTSTRAIRIAAKMNNQKCRKILRWLEEDGRYSAFGRDKASRDD